MGTSLPLPAALPAEPALPGYRGARGAILVELKREPGLTIRGLMQRLGLSANAVRHHLRELEAERMVEHHRARHGVGAPRHAFPLAAAAEPLFPSGYADALTALLDGIIQVDPDDAKEMARRAAREEGMLVGISSGATLAAIARKLPELGDNPRILGFNYDTGERYLSVPDFLPNEG